jgi:hypothetical protein
LVPEQSWILAVAKVCTKKVEKMVIQSMFEILGRVIGLFEWLKEAMVCILGISTSFIVAVLVVDVYSSPPWPSRCVRAVRRAPPSVCPERS